MAKSDSLPEARTEQINVRLTKKEAEELDDFRAGQRVARGIPSRSDIVRDAVLSYIAKSENKKRKA